MNLLNRLIIHAKFDGNARKLQAYSLPKDFQYQYWGDRLCAIAEMVRKPPPSNRFSSWLERHKSERNMLWIAIIGLFLNALIGLGQLVVAIVK